MVTVKLTLAVVKLIRRDGYAKLHVESTVLELSIHLAQSAGLAAAVKKAIVAWGFQLRVLPPHLRPMAAGIEAGTGTALADIVTAVAEASRPWSWTSGLDLEGALDAGGVWMACRGYWDSRSRAVLVDGNYSDGVWGIHGSGNKYSDGVWTREREVVEYRNK
ncbi:hypothetical protein ACLOJK_038319 [Asimina triloba]